MDHIEEFAIRECLKGMIEGLGLGKIPSVVKAMQAIEPNLDTEEAKEFLYRRSVKPEALPLVVRAARELISKNLDVALGQYRNPATKKFLKEILRGNSTDETQSKNEPDRNVEFHSNLDAIVDEWKRLGKNAKKVFDGGLYQLVRRYKPHRNDLKKTKYDWKDDLNHVIVCEILFLDSENMEFLKVTSERERHDKASKIFAYRGSLTINHEKILYGITSRTLFSDDQVNFQFFAIRLEQSSIYSGILLKAGDTTNRPVSSEFLLIKIPEKYDDIYNEISRLLDRNKVLDEQGKSVFRKYVTDNAPLAHYDPDNPTPEWKNVRFVRQFPELRELVKPPSDELKSADGSIAFSESMKALLREPSRALPSGTLINMSLQIFPIIQLDND